MLLLVARFACIGIRLIRAAHTSGSLNLAARALIPFRPVLRPAFNATDGFVRSGYKLLSRKPSAKSLTNYTRSVHGHFDTVVAELGIPKALQPKFAVVKLPLDLPGIYFPNKHLILVNKHNLFVFISKFFPWITRQIVRHELHHSYRFLEIARRGGASQLPVSVRLPRKISRVASSNFALPVDASRLSLRLKHANESVHVILSNSKALARLQRYLNSSGEKVFKHYFQPELGSINGGCSKEPSLQLVSKCVELFLSDSTKLMSLKKGYVLRDRVCKRRHQRYLMDTFETEARAFQKDYGLTKVFNRVFRRKATQALTA